MYSRRLSIQKRNLFLSMDTSSAGELILTTPITTKWASCETEEEDDEIEHSDGVIPARQDEDDY